MNFVSRMASQISFRHVERKRHPRRGRKQFQAIRFERLEGRRLLTSFQAGDANRDLQFNSLDLVEVFQAGKYEDDIPANADFSEGDWNGDREFDSSDLVLAFQVGNYEKGPYAYEAAFFSDSRISTGDDRGRPGRCGRQRRCDRRTGGSLLSNFDLRFIGGYAGAKSVYEVADRLVGPRLMSLPFR